MGERYVTVLDHMLDLSFHREAEECDKVHHEYRPKYGDIEEFKESTHQGNDSGFGDRVPELEFR